VPVRVIRFQGTGRYLVAHPRGSRLETMSSNTERLRGTFYLRTGAESEDKTALYLMGPEQGTGPLNGRSYSTGSTITAAIT
jgi:hypothetical protein